MIKKIVICLFTAIIFLPNNIYAINSNLKIGDCVSFGKYSITDANSDEEIEWIVLDIIDNKALLFSKYIIDVMPFSSIDRKTYKNSLIRDYLNNEFINNFNTDEKQKILLTKNDGYINEKYKVSDTYTTDDYIFLLSCNEISKYFYDEEKNIVNSNVYGIGTDFAKNKLLQCIQISNNDNLFSPYWLRSVGSNSEYAQVVSYSGKILNDGYFYHRFNCGLRPAMWINLY